MTEQEIQQMVNESLNNAVENGYEEMMMELPLEDLAVDTYDNDADLADLVEEEFDGDALALIPYLNNWRLERTDLEEED
jgi:hypothetical protein